MMWMLMRERERERKIQAGQSSDLNKLKRCKRIARLPKQEEMGDGKRFKANVVGGTYIFEWHM